MPASVMVKACVSRNSPSSHAQKYLAFGLGVVLLNDLLALLLVLHDLGLLLVFTHEAGIPTLGVLQLPFSNLYSIAVHVKNEQWLVFDHEAGVSTLGVLQLPVSYLQPHASDNRSILSRVVDVSKLQ